MLMSAANATKDLDLFNTTLLSLYNFLSYLLTFIFILSFIVLFPPSLSPMHVYNCIELLINCVIHIIPYFIILS